jgi:YD repeat-containing protein
MARTTSFPSYNSAGQVKSVTDSAGNTTQFVYNGSGDLAVSDRSTGLHHQLRLRFPRPHHLGHHTAAREDSACGPAFFGVSQAQIPFTQGAPPSPPKPPAQAPPNKSNSKACKSQALFLCAWHVADTGAGLGTAIAACGPSLVCQEVVLPLLAPPTIYLEQGVVRSCIKEYQACG